MSQILLYYICDDERNDDDNRKVVYVNNFHHYKHFQHPRIKYFCNPPKQDLYQNQKNNNHHLGNETCTLILRKISNPYGATHLLFWYGKLNITFLVIAWPRISGTEVSIHTSKGYYYCAGFLCAILHAYFLCDIKKVMHNIILCVIS